MATDHTIGGMRFAIVWAATAAAYAIKATLASASTPLILDTDDAMRLNEVHDLLSGQGWFDLVQHRLNTPFGGLIHWSRLVDVPEALVLAGLRPLFGSAADTAAACVWPLLLIGPLLWLSARLAVRLGGREALWPGLVLPALSLVVIAEFGPGRFDHHAPQILLSLAMLSCLLEMDRRPTLAAAAGVAAGAALSTGIESLPIVGATVLAAGLLWVADGRTASAMRDLGLGFAAATALGLAQGVPPANWLMPMTDAISIVYAAAAVLTGLTFTLLSVARLRTPAARLLAGTAAAVGIVAVLVALWPSILKGPYGMLDPWLVSHWLNRISEAVPLVQSFRDDPVYAVAVGVPVLIALITCVWIIVRNRAARRDWLVVGGMLALSAAIMVLQIRGTRLAVPLAAPVCAALLAQLWRWQSGRHGVVPVLAVGGAALGSAGIVVALLTALVTLVTDPSDAAATSRAGRNACLMPTAFTGLAALPPKRIMAPIDLGSHLILYTPHSVVAAPYHRNQQALLDALHFFNGPIGEARAILERRGVTLVVTCPALREMAGLADRAADSFISLAARGALPDWLVVQSPAAAPLTVYAVRPR